MRIIYRTMGDPEDAARYGVLSVAAGGAHLFAAAEDAMTSGAPGAAARLLTSAAAALMDRGPPAPEWPSELASRVAERLASKAEGDPAWVLFAAVLVLKDAVHVCTAGDLRVHLVRGGEVLRWTRDHVLANEPMEWIRETYGDLSLDAHGTMITRTLGSSSRPPEAVTWPADGPSSVLVCSSAVHRHRPPDAYARELLEASVGEDGADDAGLLARIDR
jgi:hypothetical protein